MKNLAPLWRAWMVGWLATIACWLWDVVGSGAPVLVSRVVVISTLGLTLAACIRLGTRTW